jgi:hypothetical protein
MSITLLTDLNIIRHSTLKKSLKIFKASTSLFPFKHDHNTQLISKCIEYVNLCNNFCIHKNYY